MKTPQNVLIMNLDTSRETDWWLQQQLNDPAFSVQLTVSVLVLQDVIKIKRLR